MAQTLNLKIAGLYTAPNQFSGSPDGGLLVADDVVVDQTNLAQSRRGFSTLAGALPLLSDRINRFDYFGGLTDSTKYIVAQWGSGKFGYYNSGTTTWIPYSGTYNPPDSVLARTRFLQQNQNLYFTTANGIYKLDSVENSAPKAAGSPAGLDMQLALTGTSGFFSQNTVGTFVGTLTNANAVITGLSAQPGNIAIGQYLSDVGGFIPAGTTVSLLTNPALVLTTTIATQAGSFQALVAGASTGIATGQFVASAASTTIASGTTVTAIAGASVSTTGNTNTSTTLTALVSTTGIVAGMFVTSVGNITSGTTVTAVSGSTVTLSQAAISTAAGVALTFSNPSSSTTTGNTTNGSTSIVTIANMTGIVPGMSVSGTGITAGAVVVSASGTTLVISIAATATNVGTTLTFAGTVELLSNAATATNLVSSPLTVSFTSPGSITMSASATGSSTETISYAAGGEVAYRLVWGYKDANNNIVLGKPTQWTSIANTTGLACNVQVTSTIPSGVSTSFFYQVFRSFQTSTASVTPSDEMQQCFEGNPNSTDISNGYIQFTDNLIDALLGTSLYTSPSQGGIGQAYAQPPMAKDFCSFFGYVLYANTQSQQSINLTVIGVGSPNGIQVGDTLTIGGITFTAGVAQNIATNTFQVFTTGTPAQNITSTVNSLVIVMNRSATSVTYAYNVSGPTSLPGMLVITSRTFSAGAFACTASLHGSAYNPALPTSGTSVSSTQTTYQNGVYCSVQNQPEAVPLANLLPLIGSASAAILRIIALRSYVIVLKTDGVFRIVGTSLSNFQVLPFDYTTHLVAPDSAVSLNNQVWCLANQGVVSISDTGVQQQSWTNINDVIQGLFGTAYSAVQQYASAVSYETDHKYILGLPSNGGDLGNTQTYTYNVFTSAWTRWTRQFTAGFVHPTLNFLYLGNFQNNSVVTERKTGTYQDFIDEPTLFPSITASSQYTITLDSVVGISPGYLLYQSSTTASVIVSIDVASNTVVVQDLLTWANGSVTIYPCINSVIQWKPVVAGNPGFLRQYCEGDLLFNTTRFNSAAISFFTELNQSFQAVPLTGFALGNWGLFGWGNAPWGGVNLPTPIRFLVPAPSQLGSQLNVKFSISQAWSNWSLQGVNIVYNDVSQEMDG